MDSLTLLLTFNIRSKGHRSKSGVSNIGHLNSPQRQRNSSTCSESVKVGVDVIHFLVGILFYLNFFLYFQ